MTVYGAFLVLGFRWEMRTPLEDGGRGSGRNKMLNSDLPIKRAEEDMLNRASFAKNLAETMLDYTVSEGFAIGLYGKWGSGKTSVLNMVLEQLELLSDMNRSFSKPIVLKFNPWLCSDPKQLISQFFKQLSSAIKLKQPKLVNVCDFMNDYADAFELAGAIPVAGNILTVIGKILGKKAKAYSESKGSDLQKIKDEIIAALSKEKIKIVVTIDDVDRLSNQEIISAFQLIKSLADFPYTIYLLAFDREVVVRALAEVQKGDGSEYLEKVIQVPFELPSPNADDIYRVFFTKIDTIIGTVPDEKWDKEYWGMLFHFGIKHYLTSIRDVVRFANTFALKYALLKNDTYPIDLIGLTCLQIFEPEIYSKLQLYKEQLCGGSMAVYNQYEQEKNEIQTAYNAIIDKVPENRKDRAENVLLALFPKLNMLKNNFYGSYRRYNHYVALSNGSISCPDCFDRYFALMLEPNAISQQLISHLIFEATEKELSKSILDLNSSRKTTRLLEHINGSFQQKSEDATYTERAKLVLTCLIQQWHKLDDDTEDSFFSMPFIWRLNITAGLLLEKIPQKERLGIMTKLFSDDKVNLSTIEALLYDFERQHGRFTDTEPKDDDKLLTLDEVLSLESIFVNRVMDEYESGVILDNPDAMSVIWLLEQIDDEKAKLIQSKIIDSDLSLAKLISATVGHGRGMGNSVFTIWNVHKESIEEYLDIDTAYKRMEDFSHSNDFRILPEEIRQNIAAFLICMENQKNTMALHDHIILPMIEKKLAEIVCGD